MKRPAFQFYPADWRNDAALRMCTLAARGLWWEMICVMHAAEPYGHLVAAGQPITPEELARIVGESKTDVTRWLAELERRKVYSVTDGGAIYSRRMVRDELARDEWRKRQARHRDVTPNVTVSVTPVSRRSSDLHLQSSSSSQKQKSKAPRRPVELPEWLPAPQWQAYLEMRQRIRKPATPYAQSMVIAKLGELREQGEHPAAVLGQSIVNSWQGIFPLKNGGKA